MQANTFPIILESARMLSPKVKHFVFRNSNEAPLDYEPGQFITIHFDCDGTYLRRSYSIANKSYDNNRIEFAAGFVENGPATKLLFNLQPGDTIEINGPFGRLVLKEDDPKRYILAATSTGITPFRAMMSELSHRVEHNNELQVVILLGVQKRDEILYKDEFLALCNTHPRIKFLTCFSREDNTLAPHERLGYVQQVFPELTLNPENDRIYLCGNPSMIDDAFACLKEQGFAMQQVIREKYISR
jgi:ferredoxin-NADP reductase